MELTKEYFDEQLKNVATKDDVQAIDKRVDNFKKFLDENMVTKQELQDLREELPTREDFNQLQVSVDGIAKHFEEQKQEQIIGAERASRMETWIIKAASKIGVEYKP
jgi:hypothetical protein